MLHVCWQEVISGVSEAFTRRGLWRGSQGLVVRLQAVSRGFLLRRRLQARRRYLMEHTPAVVLIQVRRLELVELQQQVSGPGRLIQPDLSCLLRLTGGGLSSRGRTGADDSSST